jgi:DNA-binding transcriptional regulator YdaS (Cro superfamily)
MKTFFDYYKSLSPDEKDKLAQRLKTSLGYLSQLAHGHRNPGGKILLSISSATGGVVTAESFCSKHEDAAA